jgi:transposase
MRNVYVGLDVHKETIAVAIADAFQREQPRFWGNISNTPDCLHKLLSQLRHGYDTVEIVYEAGPCGYDIYRQLTANGMTCRVVAPSRIPQCPGHRVKNDHRDAVALARLARAGELVDVWVPDEVHEAMRDLVRARHAANRDLRVARQRIQSLLLRRNCIYPQKPWTQRHLVWLADRRFPHVAQQIAFQEYLNAMDQALSRRSQLENEIRGVLPEWSLAELVNGLQALRGVGLIVAVTVVAEVGDLTRFPNAKQLMSFLGLVPGEFSSGGKVRPRGITKTGNRSVRSLLCEASWSYRQRPKIGSYMLRNMPPDLPQSVRDIAWKAQLRLYSRYRKLIGKRKKSQVAVTAVARELVGFMWSIAHVIGNQTPNSDAA